MVQKLSAGEIIDELVLLPVQPSGETPILAITICRSSDLTN